MRRPKLRRISLEFCRSEVSRLGFVVLYNCLKFFRRAAISTIHHFICDFLWQSILLGVYEAQAVVIRLILEVTKDSIATLLYVSDLVAHLHLSEVFRCTSLQIFDGRTFKEMHWWLLSTKYSSTLYCCIANNKGCTAKIMSKLVHPKQGECQSVIDI